MGGAESRESRPETDKINPKADDNLTSGQDIIQCDELSYVDPMVLLEYTFMCDYDETK